MKKSETIEIKFNFNKEVVFEEFREKGIELTKENIEHIEQNLIYTIVSNLHADFWEHVKYEAQFFYENM